MTTLRLAPVFVSPAYAREVAQVRARKATALYLAYLEYKAAFAQSSFAPYLSLAPYEHFLEMLDYFPEPK